MKIIPLIILGTMTCLGLGAALSRHGEPKKEKYNFWVTLVAGIVEWGLIIWAVS